MIYKFSDLTSYDDSQFQAGAVIYTVPPPRGKPGGISGDGRLHLVKFQTTGAQTDPGDVVSLLYIDPDGFEWARLVIIQTDASFSGQLLCTMTGEPQGSAATD